MTPVWVDDLVVWRFDGALIKDAMVSGVGGGVEFREGVAMLLTILDNFWDGSDRVIFNVVLEDDGGAVGV